MNAIKRHFLSEIFGYLIEKSRKKTHRRIFCMHKKKTHCHLYRVDLMTIGYHLSFFGFQWNWKCMPSINKFLHIRNRNKKNHSCNSNTFNQIILYLANTLLCNRTFYPFHFFCVNPQMSSKDIFFSVAFSQNKPNQNLKMH